MVLFPGTIAPEIFLNLIGSPNIAYPLNLFAQKIGGRTYYVNSLNFSPLIRVQVWRRTY